jgi:hypothetical protein
VVLETPPKVGFGSKLVLESQLLAWNPEFAAKKVTRQVR